MVTGKRPNERKREREQGGREKEKRKRYPKKIEVLTKK